MEEVPRRDWHGAIITRIRSSVFEPAESYLSLPTAVSKGRLIENKMLARPEPLAQDEMD